MTGFTPTSIPGVFPMKRTTEEEAARQRWLEAEQAALERRPVARHAVREVSQELTCDCGKRHLVRITLSVSDGLDAREDGLAIVGAEAGNGHDRALERQVEDKGSRFEAPQAIFKMVHGVLGKLSSGRRSLTTAFDSINRFEDSPAGLCLGLIVVFSALALLALNEAGVR